MKKNTNILPDLIFAVLIVTVIFSTTSCYYDNLEELNPKDTTQTLCDTAGAITYSKHIEPLMKSYCTSCHSGGSPSGGISLDSYTNVKNQAVSGNLYSSVSWDGQTSKMPKGANKIPECSISQIKKWIATNYAE